MPTTVDKDGWTTVSRRKSNKVLQSTDSTGSVTSNASSIGSSMEFYGPKENEEPYNLSCIKNSLSTIEKRKKPRDKRSFFFKDLPHHIRKQLLLDDVANFSVTDLRTANRISEYLCSVTSRNSIVTDGTACIGGNVFSFSKYFRTVQAVEIDNGRYNMLRHNIKVLGLENVVCYCQDFSELLFELKQDVVFLDPPWGGVNYRSSDKLSLTLGGMELWEICEKLKAAGTNVIAFKLPCNFNTDSLLPHIISANVTIREDFRKMLFILVDYRKQK